MADLAPPRRRFQFRLRTLMIGVTLLAAACAVAMWVIHDRQRLIRERDDVKGKLEDVADKYQLRIRELEMRQAELEAKLRAQSTGGSP